METPLFLINKTLKIAIVCHARIFQAKLDSHMYITVSYKLHRYNVRDQFE